MDQHPEPGDPARTATKSRRSRIVELVARERPASVEEISRIVGVSASTVRRDLAVLDRLGRVTRTFGGAISLDGEATLSERERANGAQKDAIARAAAATIRPGDTVFLDAGSTVGRLVPLLATIDRLTIVTNAVSALVRLAESGHEVVVVGGSLRRRSQSTVGPDAEESLARYDVDHAFLGADGVTADLGLCDADGAQSRLKSLVAARARQASVLADSSKLGLRPFDSWAELPEAWTLVTGASASADALAPFRAGPAVTVLLAE
jgi:DeoR/GlpR family transcriptional regulator of sugar metabolism